MTRKLHETFDLAKNCVRLNTLLTVTLQQLPRCQAVNWKMSFHFCRRTVSLTEV